MPQQALPNAPSPKRVSEIRLSDFRGGWRYSEDPIEVRPNELADAVNVVIDADGGVRMRGGIVRGANAWVHATQQGVTRVHYAASSGRVFVAGYNSSGLTGYFGVCTGTADAATLIDTVTTITTGGSLQYAGKSRIAEVNGRTYFVGSSGSPQQMQYVPFSSTTATLLTNTVGSFNDDYSSPSGSKAPYCCAVAEHLGYLFALRTADSGGVSVESNGARIRFSHPADGGSWRTNDWFDMPDGSIPYAAVSMGDHLVIMTSSGVWGLYGTDPSVFQLARISEPGLFGVGDTQYPDAWEPVVGRGLYLWSSTRGGLWRYDGRRMEYLGDKIRDALLGGILNATVYTSALPAPKTMWYSPVTRLLHIPMSFTAGGKTHQGLLTYNVDLNAYALWSHYNNVNTGYTTVSGPHGTHNGQVNIIGFGTSPSGGNGYLHYFDENGTTNAYDGTGTSHPVRSFIRTGWLDGGTVKQKGWKRFWATTNASSPTPTDGTWSLGVYKNLATAVSKTITWSAGATHIMRRLSGGGVARHVQLEVTMPTGSLHSLDSIGVQVVVRQS